MDFTYSNTQKNSDLSVFSSISNFTENDNTFVSFNNLNLSKPSEFNSSTVFLKGSRESLNFEEELKSKAITKSNEIVFVLKNEHFIEGEVCKTEILLESLYKESSLLFAETFKKIWLKLYAEDRPQLISNFIFIVSTFDYEWLGDNADILILAACAHNDAFVNEGALRAIESWEKPEHITYLNNVREFEIDWLEAYRKEVIEIIRNIQ